MTGYRYSWLFSMFLVSMLFFSAVAQDAPKTLGDVSTWKKGDKGVWSEPKDPLIARTGKRGAGAGANGWYLYVVSRPFTTKNGLVINSLTMILDLPDGGRFKVGDKLPNGSEIEIRFVTINKKSFEGQQLYTVGAQLIKLPQPNNKKNE